jgi:hypothetical protein
LKQSVSATGGIALTGETKPPDGVSVTDHGADPTGRRDSTEAVQAAIAKLPKIGGRLSFPKGTYRFMPSKGTILSFISYRGLRVEGNGSLLKFNGDAQPFLFADCSDLQFANLRIDWQDPPFSQGRVQSVAGARMDIALDPECRNNSIDSVEAIGQYDRATKLPSPNGIDSYHSVTTIRRTSPEVLQLTLNKPLPLMADMYLVLRHRVYGSNAVVLRKCVSTRILGITIHAAPGLGIVALGCTDIAIDALAVAPTPGSSRYMSTCSDASHFVDCRGSLSISHCSFRGMGDDAINVFASYWKVEECSAGSYHVSARSRSPIGEWQLPRAGDTLQFVDAATLVPLQQATSTRASLDGARALLTACHPAGGVRSGALVCNLASAPKVEVVDSHFLGNRARGVVAHSDLRIENNAFSGCSMPAILLAPDARWMEGPAVKNVIIRRNHFTNCGYAHPGESTGVITIGTSHDVRSGPVQEQRVNSDITVTDNTFNPSPVAAIYCAAASNISLLNNVVSTPAGVSGVASMVLVNTSSIHLRGNIGSSAADIVLDHCSNVDAGANQHMIVRRIDPS